MICSLFNFYPQSAQSRRHGGALAGLAHPNKPPNRLKHDWNMKHYKSVEFLSIFRMSSPPAQTQSPKTENFLATVLNLLLIHLLSTRSPILPKRNKSLNTYVRSGIASPKFWMGQKFDFRWATVAYFVWDTAS